MAIVLTEFAIAKRIDVSDAVHQFSRTDAENGGNQEDFIDISRIVREALLAQGSLSVQVRMEYEAKELLLGNESADTSDTNDRVVIVAEMGEDGYHFSVKGQEKGAKDPKVVLIETGNTAILICLRNTQGKYELVGTIWGE